MMPPAPLHLQSELFSATGGTAAEGVWNQLGRPRADRFALLIREAVQNSWDARHDAGGGVRFQVDGFILSRDARRALAEQVFSAVPPMLDVKTRLLGGGDVSVLAVSDSGTIGLAGPTRGDVVPKPGEATNFVDFVRYVGRPPNRPHAGGTYGFGKAAYFLASAPKTICVHSRFVSATGIDSRFMAIALGPQYESSGPAGRRFTGRHWWGRMAQDDVVDPVSGAEADEFAQLLGSVRASKAIGTTIYVLAPDFQGADPQAVLSSMASTVVEYFWPKLIDGPDQNPSMSFGVSWEGNEIQLPADSPELRLLQRAFVAASSREPLGGATLEAIASQRPAKLLGHVAFVLRTLSTSSEVTAPVDTDADMQRRVLVPPLHHLALMRAPNFVVKYVEGPLIPYGLAEYAGVFKVDAEVDAAFGRAEPPTHDDWVSDFLLEPAEKTYVRVAHRKLKEALDRFAAPPAVEPSAGGTQSVAGFSRLLGGLVPSLSQDSAPLRPPRRSSAAKAEQSDAPSSAAQVTFRGEPTTELVDGIPAMLAPFEVTGVASEAVEVIALTNVVVADGMETDPPTGSEQPRVMKWLRPDGEAVSLDTPSCTVAAGRGIWKVVVSIPPDAMIALGLKAELKTNR